MAYNNVTSLPSPLYITCLSDQSLNRCVWTIFQSHSPVQEDALHFSFVKQKTLFSISFVDIVSIQWLEFLSYGLMLNNLSSWEIKVGVGSSPALIFEVPMENSVNTEKL